jgi:branched-subunit amino acid aminotransferase/4-amino-4-deoxychorismate lyase
MLRADHRFAATLLLTLAFTSSAEADPAPRNKTRSIEISAATWDGQWPLVHRSATLSCERITPRLTAVTITVKGRTYAVNGTAKAQASRRGWHSFDDIWLVDEERPGARVSHDLIERGIEACGN